jgi:hypothetical protein
VQVVAGAAHGRVLGARRAPLAPRVEVRAARTDRAAGGREALLGDEVHKRRAGARLAEELKAPHPPGLGHPAQPALGGRVGARGEEAAVDLGGEREAHVGQPGDDLEVDRLWRGASPLGGARRGDAGRLVDRDQLGEALGRDRGRTRDGDRAPRPGRRRRRRRGIRRSVGLPLVHRGCRGDCGCRRAQPLGGLGPERLAQLGEVVALAFPGRVGDVPAARGRVGLPAGGGLLRVDAGRSELAGAVAVVGPVPVRLVERVEPPPAARGLAGVVMGDAIAGRRATGRWRR